jgi:hypothetical protein
LISFLERVIIAFMPTSMTPDAKAKKEEARVLYMLGVEPKVVSIKLGIPHWKVLQWATRQGWAREKKEKQNLHITMLEDAHNMVLSDVVLSHQTKVGKLYEENLDRLASFQAPKPKTAREYVDAVVALDTAQRRNLGMSESSEVKGSKNTFNFNLGGMKLARKNGTKDIESESEVVCEPSTPLPPAGRE